MQLTFYIIRFQSRPLSNVATVWGTTTIGGLRKCDEPDIGVAPSAGTPLPISMSLICADFGLSVCADQSHSLRRWHSIGRSTRRDQRDVAALLVSPSALERRWVAQNRPSRLPRTLLSTASQAREEHARPSFAQRRASVLSSGQAGPASAEVARSSRPSGAPPCRTFVLQPVSALLKFSRRVLDSPLPFSRVDLDVSTFPPKNHRRIHGSVEMAVEFN